MSSTWSPAVTSATMMSASGDQNERTVVRYRTRLSGRRRTSGMNRSIAALTEATALATRNRDAGAGEGVSRPTPAHIALHLGPGISLDALALGLVLEQACHGGGEIVGSVRDHDVVTVANREPFEADAGRHHRFAHGHG